MTSGAPLSGPGLSKSSAILGSTVKDPPAKDPSTKENLQPGSFSNPGFVATTQNKICRFCLVTHRSKSADFGLRTFTVFLR